MKIALIASAAIALSLCIGACVAHRPAISSADMASWQGVPIEELDAQPEFAAMPMTEKPLSNGGALRQYTSCVVKQGETKTRCFATNGYFSVANCRTEHTPDEQVCCIHTFLINRNQVVSYTPVGVCHMGCNRRPVSRPCQGND